MAKRKKNPVADVARRKKGEPLDALAKSNILSAAISDAQDYIDSTVAPEREMASRYYNGEPFGNEEDGRSQVVMTEVRDTVQAMLPSLLRVFLSTEKVVEYQPRRADAVEGAEQATDYANYVFYSDNDGANIMLAVMKDALIRKTGIFKWYVNKTETVTEERYTEITDEQIAFLEDEDGVELSELTELLPAGYDEVDPMTGEPVMQPAIYNAVFKRTAVDKKFVVEALPPEEFLIARNARSEDTAEFLGHRKDELVSDLVAMGYDLDELMEHGSPQPVLELNQESTARNPALKSRDNPFSRALASLKAKPTLTT
jgi:hypothetical protein